MDSIAREGLAERINTLLHAGSVRRYHAHFPGLIGQQNVADHTWRAMILMISLWPNWSTRALFALLVHDGAEGRVGDIPFSTKQSSPEMKTLFDTLEDDVLRRYGLVTDCTEEEQRWVKLCDWIEGLTFARDQMLLGNRGMTGVFNRYLDALNTIEMVPAVAVEYMYMLRAEVRDLFPGDIQ